MSQKQHLLVYNYYSLIYPYLTYACILWGNNYMYNAPLSQIVKLQNKAVRNISDVPLMESITPHYVYIPKPFEVSLYC